MSALGGDVRKVLDDVTGADWASDGNRIAFVRVVNQDGQVSSIVGVLDLRTGAQRE